MRLEEASGYSAKVGLPVFDEQCEALAKTVGLLDLSPLHTTASELFFTRFLCLRAAVEAFFKHEEKLLRYFDLPVESKNAHIADQVKIRELLEKVYGDAVQKKNRTAVEVYEEIKFEIQRHIASFSFDVNCHLPRRMH